MIQTTSKKILTLILLIVFLCVPNFNVYAEDNTEKLKEEAKGELGKIVCKDGFPYIFEQIDDRNDIRKLTSEDIEKDTTAKFKYTTNYFNQSVNQIITDENGSTTHIRNIKYISVGTYKNNGNPKYSSRCYLDNIEIDNEGEKEKHYEYHSCNFKYNSNDLVLEPGGNKLDNTIDGENIKDEYSEYYTTQTLDYKTGKINLKINFNTKEKSTITSILNRIKIASISYNGKEYTDNSDIAGSIKYENDGISINGITPLNQNKNGNLYSIVFYIEGMKKEDFDLEDKSIIDDVVKSCGGVKTGNGTYDGNIYLTTISLSIRPKEYVKVINKEKDNNNVCKVIKNSSNSEELKNVSPELIRSYITECYSNIIDLDTKTNFDKIVSEKYNELKNIFGGLGGSKILAKETQTCAGNGLGILAEKSSVDPFETIVSVNKMGKYFALVCTDTYYINAGTPRLVKSGMGFDYENRLEIRKSCSIIQIATVQKPLPKPCDPVVTEQYCPHDYDPDKVYHHGGPSSNFDSCVLNCDGGEYTQKCINQCYNSEYKNKNILETSLMNKINKNNTKKISDFDACKGTTIKCSINSWGSHQCQSVDGCDAKVNVNSDIYQASDYFNGRATPGTAHIIVNNQEIHTAGYSKGCDTYKVQCNYNIFFPTNCTNQDEVEAQYQNELSKAKEELDGFVKIAQSSVEIDNYTMSFYDSSSLSILEFSGSSIDSNVNEPRLVIENVSDKYYTNKTYDGTNNVRVISSIPVDYVIGSEGDKASGYSSVNVSTIYSIKVPKTYILENEPTKVIIENSNQTTSNYFTYSYSKTINKDNQNYYSFEKFNLKNNNAITDGENYYYTNPSSGDFNVEISKYNNEFDLSTIPVSYLLVEVENENDKYLYRLTKYFENIRIKVKVGSNSVSYDKTTQNKNDDVNKEFDEASVNCYYGVVSVDYSSGDDENGICINCDPTTPTPTPPQDVDEEFPNENDFIGGSESILNKHKGPRYYYREIKLSDVFPNGRDPRWNWSGTIKGDTATGAASNKDISYIVDPMKLIESIEEKGDTVFTDSSEIDYNYVLTPAIINEIRKYNKSKIDGRKITYLDFSLEVSGNDDHYSIFMKDYIPDLNTRRVTNCNNSKNFVCDNY